MDANDWQAKLKSLGVVKGARQLRPAAPVSKPPAEEVDEVAYSHLDASTDYEEAAPLERLLPGLQLEVSGAGACLVLDQVYPLHHEHGQVRLGDLLALPASMAAPFSRDDRFESLGFEQFLFLDTETTGLAGAGVLPFMVGVAFYSGEAFVVRQYFLRDHDDETAMLEQLEALLATRGGLITFNGRTFDVPLMDRRFLMNRMGHMVGVLPTMPHLDLLPASRRLWRDRSGSCALVSLEQNILALRRTGEDVPGWLIPRLYQDYLLTGDGRELVRVFYHNRLDLVSMAALAHKLVRQFSQPVADDPVQDQLALARWQLDLDLAEQAEWSLRRALASDPPLEVYRQSTALLAGLLKRQDRREEAVPLWQQLAVTSLDDVSAHVELAKHFEWQVQNLDVALRWTEQALALAATWSPARAALVQGDLMHRLERLQRKRD